MKKLLAILAAVLMVASISSTSLATQPNPDHKVTLCHRTGSVGGGNTHEGYSIITVDIAASGYVKGAHTDHTQVGNGPGPDVIPAYDYEMKDGTIFHYDGLNLGNEIGFETWDGKEWTGAEFLANGCSLPQPVDHNPTLKGKAVCDADAEEYTVTYTGNDDGADSTVPALPVVHVVPGTTKTDSATVNFKYSDGPDVELTETVHMSGNCVKDVEPPKPTFEGEAVCDISSQTYTVTYDGNGDGNTNTGVLPIVHVVDGHATSDSATVTFEYSDWPDITKTATVEMEGNCWTKNLPSKVQWEIKTLMPKQYKSGTISIEKGDVVRGRLVRHCGYMVAKIIVNGDVVKRVRISTPTTGAGSEHRTIVKLLLNGTIVDAKIGKAFGC